MVALKSLPFSEGTPAKNAQQKIIFSNILGNKFNPIHEEMEQPCDKDAL